MDLWNKVSAVPAEYVRDFTGKDGARLKGVNPQWMIQRATEEFGPMGAFWGIRNINWQVVDGTLVMCGELWYDLPDFGVASYEVYVDIPFEAGRDCFKRAQTMLTSKALSKLGFASEVYLGMWEDAEFAHEKQKESESRAKVKAASRAIEKAKSPEELTRLEELVRDREISGVLTSRDAQALLTQIKVKRDQANNSGGEGHLDQPVDDSSPGPSESKKRGRRSRSNPDPNDAGNVDGDGSSE